jgi:hypothetical protein
VKVIGGPIIGFERIPSGAVANGFGLGHEAGLRTSEGILVLVDLASSRGRRFASWAWPLFRTHSVMHTRTRLIDPA